MMPPLSRDQPLETINYFGHETPPHLVMCQSRILAYTFPTLSSTLLDPLLTTLVSMLVVP
jgi:hypothetical protein